MPIDDSQLRHRYIPPPEDWETKDSGQRQEFETGARRDIQKGKGRYDLLMVFAIRRLAGILERGAEKYGDRNFEKGMPLSRYADSALRHAFQALEGDRSEDHWGQAAWNLCALIQTEEMIARGLLPPELDDLPDYTPRDGLPEDIDETTTLDIPIDDSTSLFTEEEASLLKQTGEFSPELQNMIDAYTKFGGND